MDWKTNNPERQAFYKERYRKERLEVMTKIGGIHGLKCVYCGCDIYELLEINHKVGSSYQEYHNNYTRFIRPIFLGKRGVDDLEIACRVCNALLFLQKKFGETGHKIIWSPRPIDIDYIRSQHR